MQTINAAQKMDFPIKDIFRECERTRNFLRIRLHIY